jgi:hypothetical protein
MLRLLSAFGLGGVFLMISPHLRSDVMNSVNRGVQTMAANAPYSYIGAGVSILTVFCISLRRGAQVR